MLSDVPSEQPEAYSRFAGPGRGKDVYLVGAAACAFAGADWRACDETGRVGAEAERC